MHDAMFLKPEIDGMVPFGPIHFGYPCLKDPTPGNCLFGIFLEANAFKSPLGFQVYE